MPDWSMLFGILILPILLFSLGEWQFIAAVLSTTDGSGLMNSFRLAHAVQYDKNNGKNLNINKKGDGVGDIEDFPEIGLFPRPLIEY